MAGKKDKKAKKGDKEKEYEVEKIVDKRIRSGEIEYLLKWKGYDSSENTWEPVNFLHSTLVAEYEENLKKKNQTTREFRADHDYSKPKDTFPVAAKASISDTTTSNSLENRLKRGLQVKKILGATKSGTKVLGEKLMFLVLLEGSAKPELIPAEHANVHCPQLVIQFYEERLVWVEH